ncbi:fumarylacetoacetase [Inhella gelatinilytica]|uniref:fumarylacetoacetase n=1 Tax=Inhella gelatinilytica TaxID=2795030 RepID=A0A931IXP3_9BURK|nr:fumarylacetoacetase [Inhella gelatinilytica]MBH9553496.1 fumarylacetoacetase [Inhella gelatinilytica]
MNALDFTHDPAAQSWVLSANAADSDFPLQNLPYARARKAGSQQDWRVVVAIGDQALDLALAATQGKWSSAIQVLLDPLARGDLNSLMAQPAASRRSLRQALFEALREGSAQQTRLQSALVAQSDLEFALPARVGDYTDFYAGIHHAVAVGKLFRPDNPLLPNYKWVPIGYHGRASSLVVSGTPVRRPWGQRKGPQDETPQFLPSQRLDHELELGLWVAQGNALGHPIPIQQAEEHLFGLSLLNDWSARDIQPWEYQPLGPFLAKNFGTTLSPWIVTLEALAPFRCPQERAAEDPQPLPYLKSTGNEAAGGIDLHLEVWLHTAAQRAAGRPAVRVAFSNMRHMYWTAAQLLTHHASNGCNMQPGDLLGTGTLSGPTPEQAGSLLELTFGGKQLIDLGDGETRTFLQDGDELSLRAYAERPGARRIGLGPCTGLIQPALPAI